jgi:hypothetical protein
LYDICAEIETNETVERGDETGMEDNESIEERLWRGEDGEKERCYCRGYICTRMRPVQSFDFGEDCRHIGFR